MKYFATLEKKAQEELDVQELGPNRYQVTLRGQTHILDALPLEHGAVSLIVDGESYSVEFDDREDEVHVMLADRSYTVDVADERRLRMRAASGKFSLEGKQTVTAPMPGKVVRLLVKPGDEVTENQGLIVVEAMKMENELKSPKAGKVVEVLVQVGQAVESNAKLVTVE